MMKTFATATALMALAIAPAVAQDTKSAPKPSDTPAAQAPAKPDASMKSDAMKSDTMKSDSMKSGATSGTAAQDSKSSSSAAQDSKSSPSAATSSPSTTAQSKPSPSDKSASADKSAGKPKVVSQQTPDQWLASSFKGTDVVGPDQKKIGDVSDVLFDKDGAIQAYVVGVGGFLGIGSKDVALAPSSFEVVSGDKDGEKKLKLSMTADQLKQAEEFKPYKAPASSGQTTGMSKGSSGMTPRSK